MPGAVCLFTLKNPSYPEHICMTDSGVMCVDIHPKYPFMIVVGLYDGSVHIYNVCVNCKEPQYKSNSVTNKHGGIVWEVYTCIQSVSIELTQNSVVKKLVRTDNLAIKYVLIYTHR